MSDRFSALIAGEMGVRPAQVGKAVELFDQDNTVPFVARYRKEMTGGLDEVQLRTIQERVDYLRSLSDRAAAVIQSIDEQGKLTPELRSAIDKATTLQQVEDLYLPYKPKRRTRATMAIEKGLEPLADALLKRQEERGVNLDVWANNFLSEEVPDIEAALSGARDIIAARIAEDAETRSAVRDAVLQHGLLCSKGDGKNDEKGTFEMYYDFREALPRVPPHRILAINRGEKEKALKVKIEIDTERMHRFIGEPWITAPRGTCAPQLRLAVEESWSRLLKPAIERDVRGARTEEAEEHAIRNFGLNLGNLMMQPPLKGRTVIGLDPGFRSGCKVAVVDATGKLLEITTIYPHPPQKKWAEAKAVLGGLMKKTGADLLAIGNGTACRETESLAAEIIQESSGSYVIVSEAGASVYSASDVARKEFPELEASARGAVSIARRLQDPLAELVKIDPQSIGVGLYQHDVNQKKLGATLGAVVESAVNAVGVNVNTASPHLLRYVSGVSSKIADSIVKHRDEKGPFQKRSELKKVKALGPKTFEQAIGFLKIPDGKDPLDNTFIHPESYPVVKKLFRSTGLSAKPEAVAAYQQKADLATLAAELEVGQPTLADIFDSLAKPGRDPRDDLPKPILRQDVLKAEDLKQGMVLKGTVRNVVDFGAFVDIGVKEDGLVHVSEMADKYVSNPHEVVSVGDIVTVKVMKIEKQRGRIGLSMKGVT